MSPPPPPHTTVSYMQCPILAKFLRGKESGLHVGQQVPGYAGQNPGCGSLGSVEGAGRRQLEGKGRLAGAGGWLLATALGMLCRWSHGITLVPANWG